MSLEHKKAVHYWETRRVVFIACVAFAGHLSWGFSNSFNAGIDELPIARYSAPGVWRILVATFVVLNAVLSMGYVAEFFAVGRRFWPNPARTLLLLFLTGFGCFYAMGVAAQTADRLSLHQAIGPAMYQKKTEGEPATTGNAGKASLPPAEPEARRP